MVLKVDGKLLAGIIETNPRPILKKVVFHNKIAIEEISPEDINVVDMTMEEIKIK